MDHQNAGLGYEYTTLMNTLHVSVSKHLLDEDFTMVWANDFYYETIGYPRAEYEALYHNRPSLYYREDPEEWANICAITVETLQNGTDKYSILSRMRRRDGSRIWIRMSGTFTQEYIGGKRVAYVVMTDIDDVVTMQQEQSVTYDSLPGFVAKFRVEAGQRFRLLSANRRFFDFFGEDSRKNEECPLFRENLERNRETLLGLRPALVRGESVHFTARMKSVRGQDTWLQINGSCVDRQGEDPVYLLVYLDVTNETELRLMQKKLEDQAADLRDALHQAEAANRAKSDFLSAMSHDIRTPMNAILGMTDIAEAHLDDPGKVRDCLRKIALSGRHLLGLINDVLDMSKIESGKMVLRADPVFLPEVLENTVAIMQPQMKAKAQRFSIRLEDVRHERFISDALRLQQVFLNILSNACKYTPEGGRVTVDVSEADGPAPDAVLLTFVFTDSGTGMDPAFLAHIFEPFSRELDSRVNKTEGTGLGMAITHNIVALMSGTITVRSKLGEGSVFRVELPLRLDGDPLPDQPLPALRVLVVDDDLVMCRCTAGMLEGLGVHADWVTDGAAAVDQTVLARAQGRAFDAVLLDWKMPGQGGVETARRLRALFASLPILIISAYDWGDIADEAQAAGVTAFLSKPLFRSTLSRSLQRYVLGRPVPPEGGSRARNMDFTGRRFLLVEDNALNQEVAAELLGAAGAQVEIADDGAAGVALFRRSSPGYYDMILMDIQMPVMNGYDAARAIRALPRPDAAAIPILAMTADAFPEDVAAATAAGMTGHLAKPLDAATLQRESGKYLR